MLQYRRTGLKISIRLGRGTSLYRKLLIVGFVREMMCSQKNNCVTKLNYFLEDKANFSDTESLDTMLANVKYQLRSSKN